jgi:hypothetical protein
MDAQIRQKTDPGEAVVRKQRWAMGTRSHSRSSASADTGNARVTVSRSDCRSLIPLCLHNAKLETGLLG